MTAALPRLRSSIFGNLNWESGRPAQRHKAGTGCAALDDALGGGFRYGDGGVSCISGDTGTGKTLIAYHLVAIHILSSPNNLANIIDTTGSFDVLRLHNVLRLRVQRAHTISRYRRTATAYPKDVPSTLNNEDHSGEINRLLDQVSITPVFDFIGLREAIQEFSERLKQPSTHSTHRAPALGNTLLSRPIEIPDSQEEDEKEGCSTDSSPVAATLPPPTHSKEDGARGAGMLIIDNITSIINPLIRNHYVSGHDVLTAFLRGLSLRTHNADLCIVLLNNATASSATSSTSSSTAYRPPTSMPPPSIFASNRSVPMLGPTFAGAVDMHVLLSMMPKRAQDARAFYYGDEEKEAYPRPTRRKREVQVARVLEVLLDRHEGSQEQWGAFDVSADGERLEGLG